MTIEHLALWCRNLDALAAFYARWFGAVPGPGYENPVKGFASRFLSFEGGARLELMSRTGGLADAAPQPAGASPPVAGWAHAAFTVGDEAAVDALTRRMAAAGIPVLEGPRRTGDGYYESVVLDSEGNRIELCAQKEPPHA